MDTQMGKRILPTMSEESIMLARYVFDSEMY